MAKEKSGKNQETKESLCMKVNHMQEMEKMTVTPAFQEIREIYTTMVKDYYELKRMSDFEGVINEPSRLQYFVDVERRVKYQLEIFNYIDTVIKQGKEAEELLRVLPV